MRMFHVSKMVLSIGLVTALFTWAFSSAGGEATADTIYNVTALDSDDFIPFENDGTPNRPAGLGLGNEITLGGTARYLDHVQVVFGSIGPAEYDTYTLDLFKNDGPIDPSSGLHQPGTLIGEFQTQAWNVPLPGNGAYGVDWYFNPILVPDTLTAVVSSTYSTTTPGQYMGPFAAVYPPLTGSALNTTWYGDGTPGNWTANSSWAINDGGADQLLRHAIRRPSVGARTCVVLAHVTGDGRVSRILPPGQPTSSRRVTGATGLRKGSRPLLRSNPRRAIAVHKPRGRAMRLGRSLALPD